MLRPGQAVVLFVLALLCIGVVMVNSAGMRVEPIDLEGSAVRGVADGGVTPHSIIFSRSTLYMAMALVAMGVVTFLPVRRIADRLCRPRPGFSGHPSDGLGWLVLATIALLAIVATVYIPGFGKAVNGAYRWVEVNPPGFRAVSIQPSEFAKWGLLGVVAWYGARRALITDKFLVGMIPAVLAVGVVAGLVVVEDFGTGALIAGACVLVLVAAGVRLLHLSVFLPIALVGLLTAILTSPYRIRRLTTFLDPFADPQHHGYHMIQSMAAVASGGGTGRGLGHGFQKFGYLPEDQTDFLFAILCEELGIAGAAIVIGLYVGIVICGWMIIRRESRPMLRLFGLGVILTVGTQAVINMAVVTGLGPTKGIALPLVSAGGTGWILTAASLGVLAAMDRAQAAEDWAESHDAEPASLPDREIESVDRDRARPRGRIPGGEAGDDAVPALYVSTRISGHTRA